METLPDSLKLCLSGHKQLYIAGKQPFKKYVMILSFSFLQIVQIHLGLEYVPQGSWTVTIIWKILASTVKLLRPQKCSAVPSCEHFCKKSCIFSNGTKTEVLLKLFFFFFFSSRAGRAGLQWRRKSLEMYFIWRKAFWYHPVKIRVMPTQSWDVNNCVLCGKGG